MKKFERRPLFVEAMQVTDAVFDGPHPNPLHITDVIYDPLCRAVLVPVGSRGHLKREKANVGDWIVRYPEGNLRVYSDASFRGAFKEEGTNNGV